MVKDNKITSKPIIENKKTLRRLQYELRHNTPGQRNTKWMAIQTSENGIWAERT